MQEPLYLLVSALLALFAMSLLWLAVSKRRRSNTNAQDHEEPDGAKHHSAIERALARGASRNGAGSQH